jgi:hypothetical protein
VFAGEPGVASRRNATSQASTTVELDLEVNVAGHIVAVAIKCILGVGIALLVYGLLRESLSTLLSQLVVLPEATTFYLRAFVILLLFAGIGGGITDINVKPDARLMEYFLEVSTESSGVFQQILLTLLAYVGLVTLMVVVLRPKNEK